MKKIKRLAVVILGVAVCGLAIAQVDPSGKLGHDVAHHHGDPAPMAMAKHLAEVFPKVASFDANKDGKLDAREKEALAKAIADGSLQFPAHTPPHGEKPTAEMMVNHIAEMYAHVAPYDANHDGKLDEQEQAAIKSAIEKGEFDLHGQDSRDGGVRH